MIDTDARAIALLVFASTVLVGAILMLPALEVPIPGMWLALVISVASLLVGVAVRALGDDD